MLTCHHIEKQCAFVLIKKLIDMAAAADMDNDPETAQEIEQRFGSRLLSKTNEPEKLQLYKLNLAYRLHRLTES